MGELGMTVGSDMIGDVVEAVTRSITEYVGVALSDVALVSGDPKCNRCKPRLMPRLLRPLANSARIA